MKTIQMNNDDIQPDNNLANGHQQESAGEVVENQEDVEKPEWSMDIMDYKSDAEAEPIPPISTRDLISWPFQIAQGMDYLASKKVLHGDLVARKYFIGRRWRRQSGRFRIGSSTFS